MADFVRYILDYLGRNIILIASDPLFIGLALLILYMYKRIAKEVNNRNYRYRIEYTAVKDIIRGVIVGCVLSLGLELLGVRIPLDGQLIWLIPVAIALIFINPKLGCFSYVVPVTYVVHRVASWLFAGIPFTTQTYRQLILLVGVLHMVEGLLIVLWGHENPREEPMQRGHILVRVKKMTKYWPVPLIVFHHANGIMNPIILYAFLGYGDLAIGNGEKQKSHLTGSIVLVYGVCVTMIGVYGLKSGIFLPMVMVIMPLLHESLFKITLKIEENLQKKREAES